MKLMEQEFAELRERLYPMLMDVVQIQEKGEGQMLNGPLTEGLIVIYAIEEPNDKVRYVTYQDLRDWGTSHTTVHVTAVKNLDRLTEGKRVTKLDRPEGRRPMMIWNLQDGYDAARILLPARLNEFAEAVPGRLVLGVPHRNWLVAIGDEDPELLNLVQKRVQQEHRNAPFPVSPYLYTWDGEQLTRYQKEA
ncbi:MAG TPA: DUF1444 family protein [Symbiobacteriaceae bacterium]|nr:DUF1444 family protein [Symbiobacteriaceae bacterium]